MIIKTWRDPYDAGFSPTKPKEIELHTGLTVLVGCNGAGKSTLLMNIEDYCKENDIPCLKYDNLHDGGHNALSGLFYWGDFSEAVAQWSYSEGESIKANVGRKATTYKEFIQNGYVNDRRYRLSRAFSGEDDDIIDIIENKDRVFLFDAVDSGLSVDSIVEVKKLFDMMLETNKDTDKNIYIVIAANEYELARNSDCFDVNAGKYITFKDYEEYRAFILKSREHKEKRIDQQEVWRQKKKEKELAKYKKIKALQDEKLAKFTAKYKDQLDDLPYSLIIERDRIIGIAKDFLRHARFISEEDVEGDNYV